jgi:hypothetical protein
MSNDHRACDPLIMGTKKPPCGCRAAKIFDQGSNTRFLQKDWMSFSWIWFRRGFSEFGFLSVDLS